MSRPTEFPQSAFISYAREDRDFAIWLTSRLKERGTDTWRDEVSIAHGEPWAPDVEEGIRACEVMLIILSPDSVRSENVLDELHYALEEKKRVIPLLYRPCRPPLRIRRRQYVDFTGPLDDGLAALLEQRMEKPSWRSRFPRAFKVVPAIAAAVLAAAFYFLFFAPSRTSVAVAASDATAVVVLARNRGAKPSSIAGGQARLKFADLPIEDQVVVLSDPETTSLIPARSEVAVRFGARGLLPKLRADGSYCTEQELATLMRGRSGVLEVRIRESDGRERPLGAAFPIEHIRDFVLAGYPDHVPRRRYVR